MKHEKEDLNGQLNLFDPELSVAQKKTTKIENDTTKTKQVKLKEKDKENNKERDKENNKENDDDTLNEEIKEEMKQTSKNKEPEFVSAKADDMHVAMYRMYEDILSKELYIVAYIDYNKVYCKEKKSKATLLSFPSASRAVDYYIEKVESYMKNQSLIEDEDDLLLEDVFL